MQLKLILKVWILSVVLLSKPFSPIAIDSFGDARCASPFFDSTSCYTDFSHNCLERNSMSDFPVARSITLDPIESSSQFIDGLVSKLSSYCSSFGLPVDEQALCQCVLHLLYVEQVNHYINLTRITDLDEALILHILDSLLFLPFIPEGSSRLLDMGSGPGYPGLPLSLCSGIETTLLDSVTKKMNAVHAIANIMGLLRHNLCF